MWIIVAPNKNNTIIMAEVTLKKKITLKRKEEQADFTFSGKLKVKLSISTISS